METNSINGEFYNSHMQDPGGRGYPYEQRSGYKSYDHRRRPIQSSPNQIIDTTYGSPVYSTPRSGDFQSRDNRYHNEPIDMTSFKVSPTSITDPDFTLKNPIYANASPNRTAVSMPGGYEYDIGEDENRVMNNQSPVNRLPQYPSPHIKPHSANLNHASPYTHSHHSPHSTHYHPSPRVQNHMNRQHPSPYTHSTHYHPSPNHMNRDHHRSYDSPHHQMNGGGQYYGYDSPHIESIRRIEEERREDKKIMRALMEGMNEMREERIREKEEREREREREEREKREKDLKHQNQRTPSGPGFRIPKSEPVETKSRIPDYESMDDIEKDIFREKFRNNYNTLKKRYPIWDVEVPDFNILTLRTIHERYEDVVKMICIYQTAMKWKVYLVVIFAGIEYYVGYKKEQAWCRGLLESQIKVIHKFDSYLIEFATMFYSDEVGDDYPLWIRFLGTFATGLATFATINGAAKSFGMSAPESLLNEADKFVSPSEGTARLRSDGISDVPEAPEHGTMQDPNSAIAGIKWVFDMAKGFFGGSESSSTNTQNTQPAQPTTPDIQTKKVNVNDLDDLDDADL